VRAASLADTQAERLLADPALCRAEALALFNALAAYFGWQEGKETAHVSGRVSDGRGNAIAGALVWLDGWLPTQTDSRGRFMFENAGAGKHNLTAGFSGQSYGPREVSAGRPAEILLGGE